MKFVFKNLYYTFIIVTIFFNCKQKNVNNSDEFANFQKLRSEARKYKDTMMENGKADSLAVETLKFALISNNDFLISSAYGINLRDRKLSNITVKKGKEYFSQALNSAEKIGNDSLVADSYLQICNFSLEKDLPNDALNYLNMMPETELDKNYFKIQKLIILSKIDQMENQPYDQLRNLMDANYKAYDADIFELKNETYLLLSNFYLNEKKYENALKYNDLLKESITSQKKLDSTAWYYSEANRLVILTQYVDNKAVIEIARKINDYGIRKHIPQLCYFAQSSLRTYLIDHADLASLEDWYKKYPGQLRELKEQNIAYFYRVKAFIAENHKEMDSASYYFDAALQADSLQNDYSLYNHFLRKGDFEKRNDRTEQAFQDYERSFEYSLKTNNYYNQIDVGEEIVNYFTAQGENLKSNQYLKELNVSKTNLIQFLSNENIRNVELSNILAQKELERKKILEKKETQHNQQYLLITMLIILIIMTMVVFSYYKIPTWWIRSMGYLSFLMFFEFIIMLIDGWWHNKTHGEPWKILLFKVALLSLLVPFHHWIEKTIVNLLLQDHLRNFVAKYGFKKKPKIEIEE